MSDLLTDAQRLKFALFAQGLRLTDEALALINRPYGERPLTLADYASTSGIGLVLEGDVWVNAPIIQYNANFAGNARHELRAEGDRLFVRDLAGGTEVPAQYVPVPAYHDQRNGQGELFTDYVHTHTDRARLSPIRGCAMRCRFCDIPYEFKGKYHPKPIVRLLEAAARALDDPLQPAAHLLISGGTPANGDREYLRQVYRRVIAAFEGVKVDVMMVPVPGVFDLDEVCAAGVNELSLNLEIWDEDIAARLMPEKARYGRKTNLDFIAKAVERLGENRVRSILMVGLEPPESTLQAIDALIGIGCVPVLSPFRPDPITELKDWPPPSAEAMTRLFLDASELAARRGSHLGPGCIPCTHNTMTLADDSGYYHYHDHRPRLI